MPLAVLAGFLVFQFLMVMVHLAVYAGLGAAFGIGGPAVAALFVVLALTFVSASVLARYKKGSSVDWYYRFSAYWFGLINFLFIGAVAMYAVMVVLYGRAIYVPPWEIGAVTFGTTFLLHLYGTWKSQHPEVTNVKVPFSHLPGFDADFWKGKQLVFVSDFQLGNVYRDRFLGRAIKKIHALDPYAVFIGGDLYDGVACDVNALVGSLKGLRAPGGAYFITGNHEYYLPTPSAAIDAVRASGIRVLENETAALGGGVTIAGVDYLATHKKEDFRKVIEGMGIDRTHPSILLKHEPHDLDVAADAGVSLVISGHTHHGQIWPLNFFTWQMYKGYDYGLKAFGAMQVLVSSGIGTWGPPLRLGTKSEIMVIEFV